MQNVMNWDFFNKHVLNLKTLLVDYIQGHCDFTCTFTVNEIILQGLLKFTLRFCEKLSTLHASVNCRSAFSSNILKQLFFVWLYLLANVTSVHWGLQAFVYAWSPTTDFQSGLKKSRPLQGFESYLFQLICCIFAAELKFAELKFVSLLYSHLFKIQDCGIVLTNT